MGLLNAYSRGNRGDGLLVDLAVDMLQEAYGSAVKLVVVGQDPKSFAKTPGLNAAIYPHRWEGASLPVRAVGGLLTLVAGRATCSTPLRNLLDEVDVLVSVGGAYLRGSTPGELAKTTLMQLSQTRLAAAANKPWVALPQSVGPYPRRVWPAVRGLLSRADAVFVRDDRSLEDLGGLANVHRVPDSAVLGLANASPPSGRSRTGDGVGLVLRRLSKPGAYEDGVRRLLSLRSDWVSVLQSDYSGNDDRSFVLQMTGQTVPQSLPEAIGDNGVRLVVSVRLHGALEAIMSGVPAIHLGYERKSVSAFQDLGLKDFVFNARNFAPDAVMEAVEQIIQDPGDYWARVERVRPVIQQARATVIDALRKAHSRPLG
ncbi:polysaccharide pyruvyl transferase family protein [Blastococcus sp. SYSU DS0552]